MVDYHSRWIEILHLKIATSSAVIAKMKDVFARLGLPQEVLSDNGPNIGTSVYTLTGCHCSAPPAAHAH